MRVPDWVAPSALLAAAVAALCLVAWIAPPGLPVALLFSLVALLFSFAVLALVLLEGH